MKKNRIALLLSIAIALSTIPSSTTFAAVAGNRTVSETKALVSASTNTVTDQTTHSASAGWQKIGGVWYYKGADGKWKTGWQKIDGFWYYLNSNSAPATGWKQIYGNWYHFNNSGMMQTGWKKINGYYFYFQSNGTMKTGWVKNGNDWYYTSSNGIMKTGWQKIDSKWYFFDPNGKMHRGWLSIGGNWYYFYNSGAMVKGERSVKVGSRYYYFETTGALAKKAGWRVSSYGNSFYVNADGSVATNMYKDGANIGSDGVAILKTDNAMDAKAQQYYSDTNYLILANKSTHKLCIYKGNHGNWHRIESDWVFTCGGWDRPTREGEFCISYKQGTPYGWKRFSLSRAAYCTYVCGGFYFHSILYSNYGGNVDPSNVKIVDATLGSNLSHGCLRLSLSHAKWIYQNMPVKTTVVTYS